MKLILFQIGKTTNKNYENEIIEYSKRIKKYMPFEIKTVPETKYKKNQSIHIRGK